MKTVLLLTLVSGFLALRSLGAFAADGQPPRTLGVLDGIYDGSGPLKLESLIPMKFTSHRVIHDGVVEAQSTAYLLGKGLVTVNARLRFQPLETDTSQFDVLDLDQNGRKVGSAACGAQSCHFDAKIMKDTFYLKETWTPSDQGFVLSDGFQIDHELQANYSGTFRANGSSQ